MPKKPAVRIKTGRAIKIKTKLVCAKCGAEWNRDSNPSICPECKEGSFGISIKANKGDKDHG